MTISDVQQRILLTDIERPKEPLDVEILELTATDLTVKVANTEVLFRLRKREIGMMFEGSLGARSFEFDAEPLVKPAAKAKNHEGRASRQSRLNERERLYPVARGWGRGGFGAAPLGSLPAARGLLRGLGLRGSLNRLLVFRREN